ncbi:hypothetical protein PIB30_085729 [Stylosanthes scabra]|uniref:Uncharacterized protein n=1 Tax=Stylosanthes scabra TaxID=79078 RepID=A0ABU6ZRJ5_9FABA|nr:hypothetical protein [Stylosanthes scabra]
MESLEKQLNKQRGLFESKVVGPEVDLKEKIEQGYEMYVQGFERAISQVRVFAPDVDVSNMDITKVVVNGVMVDDDIIGQDEESVGESVGKSVLLDLLMTCRNFMENKADRFQGCRFITLLHGDLSPQCLKSIQKRSDNDARKESILDLDELFQYTSVGRSVVIMNLNGAEIIFGFMVSSMMVGLHFKGRSAQVARRRSPRQAVQHCSAQFHC